ncbi:hypothetical protein M9458_053733, partial [Cirrhinus mrigala]
LRKGSCQNSSGPAASQSCSQTRPMVQFSQEGGTASLSTSYKELPEMGSPEERDQLTCQDPLSTRGRVEDSAPFWLSAIRQMATTWSIKEQFPSFGIAIGTLGQLGKEQILPSNIEYLFSQCGTGFSHYDSTSFPRPCTVSAEVRENTQTQESGLSEILPEAPGAHGILSHGHATGPDAYETAASLASYLSPEMGMAPRTSLQMDRYDRCFQDRLERVCNGHAASGVWTGPWLHWHINGLESLTVLLALKRFWLLVQGKHVFIQTTQPSPALEPA